MIVQCKIVDSTTGEPVPGATVSVLRNDGTATGVMQAADGNGNFYLDIPQDTQLSITAASYTPVQVSANTAANSSVIDLEPNVTALNPVVVTATAKKHQALAFGGLLLLLLLLTSKK